MADVRVVIAYTDELESISIDNMEMDDISAIQNKPIQDWFSASNGRDGWEGLIPEIQKIVNDETAILNFEFQGSQESKHFFEECVSKFGQRIKINGFSADEIAKSYLEDAQKAEHRSQYKFALDNYINADNSVSSAETEVKIAELYKRYYQGEIKEIGLTPEDALVRAIEYYKKAAEKGNNDAQCQLYAFLAERKHSTQIIDWLQWFAEKGNAKAQNELGHCYNTGNGIASHFVEALKCYKKAADQGLVDAEFNLGCCYENSLKNFVSAFEWFKTAAEHGNSLAQRKLGEYYKNGIVIKKNFKKAYNWILEAAKNEDVEAELQLGHYYETGIGIRQDFSKAFEWYAKAAKHGNAQAQNNLAIFYETGKGIEKNLKLAFEWYMKAAQQEYPEAWYRIGACFENGKGVEKNLNSAFEWYVKAASKYPKAQYRLGVCCEIGKGVEKNLNSAFEWYMRAGQQECPEAQYRLGVCFENGRGIEKNLNSAFEWYMKAAQHGYPDAQCSVGRCYEFEIGTKENCVQAVQWYESALKNGCFEAAYRLGKYYEEESGIDHKLGRIGTYYLLFLERYQKYQEDIRQPIIMQNEIKEACISFCSQHQSLTSINGVPNLKTTHGLNCGELYFVLDSTLFHNGKNGIIISQEGIFHRFTTTIEHISFDELAIWEVHCTSEKNPVVEIGKTRLYTGVVELPPSELCELFLTIKEIVQRNLGYVEKYEDIKQYILESCRLSTCESCIDKYRELVQEWIEEDEEDEERYGE